MVDLTKKKTLAEYETGALADGDTVVTYRPASAVGEKVFRGDIVEGTSASIADGTSTALKMYSDKALKDAVNTGAIPVGTDTEIETGTDTTAKLYAPDQLNSAINSLIETAVPDGTKAQIITGTDTTERKYTPADINGAVKDIAVAQYAGRTAMKEATGLTAGDVVYLSEGGRSGTFEYLVGDYSAEVAADTLEGVYVKLDAVAATVGVLKRRLNGYVTPEMFGAKDSGADTSLIMTNTIPLAASLGLPIVFNGGKFVFGSEVIINQTVDIKGDAVLSLASSFADGGSNTLGLFAVTANDVNIEGLTFDGSDAIAESVNNRLVWVTGDRVTVRNCSFKNLPSGGNNFNGALGFSAATERGIAIGNRFVNCPGAVFTQGRNTIISNNIADAPKDVSFAVNGPGATGCSVVSNHVYANNLTCSIHIGIEEGAQKFVVVGNSVFGVKDGIGIGCITVAASSGGDGGVIANNVVDGGGFTSTAPSALLDVGVNYSNIKVHGNIFMNGIAGNSNNVIAKISANNNEFQNNKIIAGSNAVGLCLAVSPAGGNLMVANNDIDAGGLSFALRFFSGDNGGSVVRSYRNIYRNAAEGINTTLPTNMPLYQEDDDFIGVTNPLNGPDWASYFNADGGYRFPHKMNVNRIFYGVPNAPTVGTWAQGDTIYHVAPTAGGWSGIKCIVSGSPGQWRDFGSIVA